MVTLHCTPHPINPTYQAFDMNFFDEIEDLKFKYAQVQKENKRLRGGR